MTVNKNFLRLALAFLLTFVVSPRLRAAEVDFSFLTTLGYTTFDRESRINTNFRGDDPFNPVRITAFAESWIHPRLGIFLEFLWDQGESHTGTDTRPRVNGAYAVARPWDSDRLLFKLGLIPTNFGTWGPRTYSDVNPLVGIPLMYHYRTPASSRELPATYDELRDRAGARGLPILYDSCWPFGITAFGFAGDLEYYLMLTKESPSSPRSNTSKGGNLAGHLAWNPSPAFTLGGSFSVGRYLPGDVANLPAGTETHDVLQKIVGMDLRYSRGWTEIHSELIRNWWENPLLGEDMPCTSGYLELKQKLSAGLYFAARYDRIVYDEFSDSSGGKFTWGDNLTRFETGAAYNFARGILLKLVWQHNNYEDSGENVDLLNTQLVLTF
ncbi:MAG: hypothetical protein FVQ81_13810 [Candidatus Glassbacteria bacterium]|nr:hypothetical protein [Candidatus Glassbacteria bacterium]